MNRDPIIITGAARSGTSLTAGIVHICGAFGGEMSGPNQFNQKGMFENTEVRNNVQKAYLSKIACDPMGQKPLPNSRQVFQVSEMEAIEWRWKVKQIYQYQGYIDGPWFYKGAKCCLIWYMWHLAFPNAHWIIVRRDREEIARSCMRTRFMSKYMDMDGWRYWVDIHLKRFDQMKRAGLNLKEVWPSKMIQGDFEEMRGVIDWLKLDWKDNMIRSFVEPNFWGGGK